MKCDELSFRKMFLICLSIELSSNLLLFFVSGPAVIAQPLYQSSTADLDLEDGVQYVTLEEFFNDKSEIVTSTNQGIIYVHIFFIINR